MYSFTDSKSRTVYKEEKSSKKPSANLLQASDLNRQKGTKKFIFAFLLVIS
jgi:hypothetical protein